MCSLAAARKTNLCSVAVSRAAQRRFLAYQRGACLLVPRTNTASVATQPFFSFTSTTGLVSNAGLFLDAKKIVWGDWSVESQYVTLGQAAATAPAAAAAAAPAAGFGKKRNKKVADKGTEKKMSTAAAQQAAADEQNAIQQLQVQISGNVLLLLLCTFALYLLCLYCIRCTHRLTNPLDSQPSSLHCIVLLRSVSPIVSCSNQFSHSLSEPISRSKAASIITSSVQAG